MREKIIEFEGWRIRVRPLRLRDSVALQAWAAGIDRELQGQDQAFAPEAAGMAYLAGILSACSDILAVPDGVDPEKVLWNVEAFLDMPLELVEMWTAAAIEVNPRLVPKEGMPPAGTNPGPWMRTTSGGTGSSESGSTKPSSEASRRNRPRRES